MRIITGKHRGRKISSLNSKMLRPTANKVREMIFNILEHGSSEYLKDSLSEYQSMLDVCCGTATMSFEAISRGVKSATLMDINSEVLELAMYNAKLLGEAEVVRAIRADTTKLGKAQISSDLCFIDPPYEKSLISPILLSLSKNGWLSDGAVIIIESARKDNYELPDGFKLFDERISGKNKVAFCVFQKAD